MAYLDKSGLEHFWGCINGELKKLWDNLISVSQALGLAQSMAEDAESAAETAKSKALEAYNLAASHQTEIGKMQGYLVPYLYVTSNIKTSPLGTLKDCMHLRSSDLIDGFGLSGCPLGIFNNLISGSAVVRAWMVQQSGSEYRVTSLTPVLQGSGANGQITFSEVTGMSSADKGTVKNVCVEIVPSLLMYQ